MLHRKNFLLSELEPEALARISPLLSMVELHQSEVLAETHHRIEKVYFPHSGIISCIVQLKRGDAIQTGMIGNDGAFGAGQALDDRIRSTGLWCRLLAWHPLSVHTTFSKLQTNFRRSEKL